MNEYYDNHVVVKPITDYEGYFVDNFGAVYTALKKRGFGGPSVPSEDMREKKQTTHPIGGHKMVSLRNRTKKVHQLVLSAFVGPKPNKGECLHIDGNPANNHVSNLRWGTHKENMEDMARHGRSNRGTKNPNTKINEEDVRKIREMAASGLSSSKISESFPMKRRNISRIISGERWGWLEE